MRKIILENKNLIQSFFDANGIMRLIEFLGYDNYCHLQYEALWCLANISNHSLFIVESLLNKNILEKLINFLHSPYAHFQEQNLLIISNIASIFYQAKNKILNSDIPQLLLERYNSGLATDIQKKLIILLFSNILKLENNE